MRTKQFIIEEYVDNNSKNMCEIFSVTINNHKVYERDYGSQTEDMQDYIEDYELIINQLNLRNYGQNIHPICTAK